MPMDNWWLNTDRYNAALGAQQNALALKQQQQAMYDEMQKREAIMRNRPKPPQMVTEEVDTPKSAAEQMDEMSTVPGAVPASKKTVNRFVSEDTREPQSIYDIQANQFWEQQQQAQYTNFAQSQQGTLKAAFDAGNDDAREAYVKLAQSMYEKTGNEHFKNSADMYSKLKFENGGLAFDDKLPEDPEQFKKFIGYVKSKAKNVGQVTAIDGIKPGDYKSIYVDKDGVQIKQSKSPMAKGTTEANYWTKDTHKPVMRIGDHYQDMDGNRLSEDDVEPKPSGGKGGGTPGRYYPYKDMPGYFINTAQPGLFKLDEAGNYVRTTKETAPRNVRQEMMDFRFAANPKNRGQYEVAKSLPHLIDKVVESGKKLDYSDVQFLGKLDKWKKGQLNDPQFIDYMVKRNDAMLELVQVLRNNGVTDQAHAAEMEVSNPTMSPRALEAWGKAQIEALNVRTDRFTPIFEKEPIPKVKKQVQKPKSMNEWMFAAKKANPTATDAELKEYYKKKYGRK